MSHGSSRLRRARSTVYELACMARVAVHLDRFVAGRPWSASRLLDERVLQTPNGLALAYLEQRYTFRDVDRRTNQYAGFFRSRGVGRGDVVALLMDNRPDYLFVVLALSRLGAIASLINTNLSGTPLTHAITVCKPVAVLVGAEHVDAVQAVVHTLGATTPSIWVQGPDEGDGRYFEPIDAQVAAQSRDRLDALPPPNSSDVMAYVYTSGTTGLPKAAIVTNKRFLSGAYLFGRGAMDASTRDVVYIPLPLYHANALIIGFGSALATGAAVALRRKFSASQFWDDVVTYGATSFVYIGELCRYLLHAPRTAHERCHHLRVAVGNGLRPDAWGPFQERFAVPVIREFYGATEGNALILNFEGRPGMLGRLKPGQVIVRCDEGSGELQRSASGFCQRVEVGQKGILLGRINPLVAYDGYVDKQATGSKVVQDVFARGDRYFNSGDILQLHEEGWVSFADRVGDTYRWKGENVSTNEVAEVLNGAPGILDSNVYGVAVPGAEGRAGMASVVASGELDLAALGRYVVHHLPAYQRPYFLRLQRDMRLTGTLKHQKGSYRDEGFDPGKIRDPLFFLTGGQYVVLDAALFQQIQAGLIELR